ncbi:phage major capsid protein [Pannonibacter tanglangensis]|uniref:phage major capsid protein n=1 Tax=Pannonibacter tanglangensis TaxID=2750084 RepID=UPI00329A3D26
MKELSVGSEADSGFKVHAVMADQLNIQLKFASPDRSTASVIYKRPFSYSGPCIGRLAETAACPATSTLQTAELSSPPTELYVTLMAIKQLLEYFITDVESWLVQELIDAFSAKETGDFISGSGNVSPRGFILYLAGEQHACCQQRRHQPDRDRRKLRCDELGQLPVRAGSRPSRPLPQLRQLTD